MMLSEQQAAAVEHLGSPALVVAGAGSGKTRTLTARFARLMERGIDSRRILAITFTNKAAGEMKTRLMEMTGLHDTDFPWVRTYHSACYMILKKHCTKLGYRMPLEIFSSYHQQKTIKEIALSQNIDKKHAPAILSEISRAKNSGNVNRYFDAMPLIMRSRTEGIYRDYERILREKNALDFDNILCLTRDLLRDYPEIQAEYREKFQHILVDEYQDTNNLQEEITRLLLGHENLFCVGDDWQAVYGFRGSNVSHFLSFPEKYPNAQIFRLEQNYRSADEIVQLANGIIGFNESRMDKRCFSEKKGAVIEPRTFFNEFEEAEWVARKIRNEFKSGVDYEDMVVMYRTKALSLWFEKALRQLQIPYQMVGSKGFFERKEILDLNCYLLAAAFPSDDVAFERIVNTPKRGIGPSMISKIAQARVGIMGFQESARSMVKDRVLSKKVHEGLTDIFDLLDTIKEMAPDMAIQEVLNRTGYLDHLQSYCKTRDEFDTRKDQIDELMHTASLKETIHDYLEDVNLVREDKDDDDGGGKGVHLSTVHASKGLEYQMAFIVGLEEQLFPHWRSMESDRELEEERRLMYVAVTRAETHLYVTSASSRRKKRAKKSRFFYELDDAMDELGL
ncbi:DNA helicase [Desulfoluna limicola]|uniref:DNA 3'-5' helicase n=1 Tax=Desulfoluna limicola TaxID=2810562 RepID=A0ABM7PL16_9BACT|nr:UvrD-helicase domain-containing protein [Desulfoluna limicola]BCS97904.1 DNA helicase [Desulfoluna limicola]